MARIDYEGRDIVDALMNVIDACITSLENVAMANKVSPYGYINIFNAMCREVENMERAIKEKQNVL